MYAILSKNASNNSDIANLRKLLFSGDVQKFDYDFYVTIYVKNIIFFCSKTNIDYHYSVFKTKKQTF